MSDWKAVVEDATGRLVSVGTVIADQLPSELTVIALVERPLDDEMWDEPTRSFVARPVPTPPTDRLDDLRSIPDFLPAIQRGDSAAVLTMVGRLLGRERFRNQAESVNVGEDPPVVRPRGR